MRVVLALLILSGVAVPQERVLVRRLSDAAAVRTGDNREERLLYYFSPTAELIEGDEIEQGSSGHVELLLTGGGYVALHSAAHVFLDRLDAEGDVLRFEVLTLARVVSVDRQITCLLPGGARCVVQDTRLELALEPGRIQIRNVGTLPLDVYPAKEGGGDQEPQHLRVSQGEEVRLPLFRLPDEGAATERETWGRLSLRRTGGFLLGTGDDVLSVRAGDDAAGGRSLLVGGVAASPRNQVLLISNRRRPFPETSAGRPTESGIRARLNREQIRRLLDMGLRVEDLRAQGLDVPEDMLEEFSRERGTARRDRGQPRATEVAS